MLKFSDFAKLGRSLRQDDPDDLGVPTQTRLREAIEAGRDGEANELIDYTISETKSLHDLMCDWVWDLLSRVAERHGEDEMFEILRGSQSTWMLKRTWKAFLAMTVEQRLQVSAEMMRAHHCGPDQDGSATIVEEDDCYRIEMDPCGSGGRMRRGDVLDGTPSRLGPPYNFGSTEKAHDWSFGQKGVPYYCVHCAVNELLPMEWGGHPLWVTDYDPDASKPCAWRFYKTAEAIPEKYYTRAGRKKPGPGQGSY